MAAPGFDQLRPYLAPVLLRTTGAQRDAALLTYLSARVASRLAEIFKDDQVPRPLLAPVVPHTAGGSWITFIVYEDKAAPSWWASGPKEVRRELVVLGVLGDVIALCGTDAGIRDGLVRYLRNDAAPLSRDEMTAAFLGPEAKTVWLQGVHTPSAVKASSKVLSGSALEYALDPLGDQTYYLSAARSRPSIAGLDRPAGPQKKPTPQTLGASPGRGRVWVGWPPEWKAFADQLHALMAHVKAKPKAQKPSSFDRLASVVTDLGQAKEAYAMALVPRDLMSEDAGLSDEARHVAHEWAYEAAFDVQAEPDATLKARVTFFGNDVGTMLVAPKRKADRVVAECQWVAAPAGFETERETCKTFVEQPDSLKVYYRDHTLSDGALYLSGWTDHPFDWKPVSFAGYDVWREKPKQNVVGKTTKGKDKLEPLVDAVLRAQDNSLFDFVRKELHPTGYLACDDGAMEIADFVHLDLKAAKVSLIHVKGSGHKPGPGGVIGDPTVSVADFEVVVAQAIKNLRHLNQTGLEAALKAGKKHQIAKAIWLDGQQSNRVELLKTLKDLKILVTEVVIVQPRLTKAEQVYCEAHPKSLRGRRYRQLNALMLGARLSAMACGATLKGLMAA